MSLTFRQVEVRDITEKARPKGEQQVVDVNVVVELHVGLGHQERKRFARWLVAAVATGAGVMVLVP
jgi:hypothetical protein